MFSWYLILYVVINDIIYIKHFAYRFLQHLIVKMILFFKDLKWCSREWIHPQKDEKNKKKHNNIFVSLCWSSPPPSHWLWLHATCLWLSHTCSLLRVNYTALSFENSDGCSSPPMSPTSPIPPEMSARHASVSSNPSSYQWNTANTFSTDASGQNSGKLYWSDFILCTKQGENV